jgi:hypothetical protein
LVATGGSSEKTNVYPPILVFWLILLGMLAQHKQQSAINHQMTALSSHHTLFAAMLHHQTVTS